MQVVCPSCNTEFEFDTFLLAAGSARVRCTRCAHIFVIEAKPGQSTASAWWLRRSDGRTERVDALTTIVKWARDGLVRSDDAISQDGLHWRSLGDIAELSGLLRIPRERPDSRANTMPSLSSVPPSVLDTMKALRVRLASGTTQALTDQTGARAEPSAASAVTPSRARPSARLVPTKELGFKELPPSVPPPARKESKVPEQLSDAVHIPAPARVPWMAQEDMSDLENVANPNFTALSSNDAHALGAHDKPTFAPAPADGAATSEQVIHEARSVGAPAHIDSVPSASRRASTGDGASVAVNSVAPTFSDPPISSAIRPAGTKKVIVISGAALVLAALAYFAYEQSTQPKAESKQESTGNAKKPAIDQPSPTPAHAPTKETKLHVQPSIEEAEIQRDITTASTLPPKKTPEDEQVSAAVAEGSKKPATTDVQEPSPLDDSGPISVKRKDYQLSVERGFELLASKTFARAEKHFMNALQVEPSGPEAHMGLGYVMLERRGYAGAEDHFKAAADAGNAEGWKGLAEVAKAQGQKDKARDYLRRYASTAHSTRKRKWAEDQLKLLEGE